MAIKIHIGKKTEDVELEELRFLQFTNFRSNEITDRQRLLIDALISHVIGKAEKQEA